MDQTNFADQFVNGLLSWVRWTGEKIVGMFQSQSTAGGSTGSSALFDWFANNWIGLLVVLVVVGILLDWIVWMVRWRPYWLWFGKKRVLYDDDIDIDLSDEELDRRFGPMEPRIESREHFRASQLGRAGRPVYGDDEDIDYMMGREPARPALRDVDDDEDDYDDGPDVEDPYDGYAEDAYRRQTEARRAQYQPRGYEAVDEDDAFDELYDEDEDDLDDELYGEDDEDDELDEFDGDDGELYDDELYDDASYDEDDDGLAEYEDDEDDDLDAPPAQPAKSAKRLFARKPRRAPEPEADRGRPAQGTAFVSASRGGRRTGSELIHAQKPPAGERAGTFSDPNDDPFSVDGLIGDEDDGFLDVVSSMAESPLPPVGRPPKNMPDPKRDAEIATEFAPDPDMPPSDWRTGYSGAHDAVRAPHMDERQSAFEEVEASSRRARRRARDQASGQDNASNEGTLEDE